MKRLMQTKEHSRAAGTTLVEIMLAVVILAIVAVAGGAYLFHGRMQVDLQNNKRVALEIANSRLEELRAAVYDDIKPTTLTYALRYVRKTGGTPPWASQSPDPLQKVSINSVTNLPMTTTVQYLDLDGPATNSYDALRLTVSVGYRLLAPASEAVTLQTVRIP
jgi:type II secretory pathway pseudopilin PulG